nr:prolipoprotein diacylglyceryl transferase family protein [Naumannella halotolerans]
MIALDRRFRLGHGKAFMLYVMLYTAGRAWVEHLRIDPAHHLGPFRLNDYVSVIVFLAALSCFLWLIRNKPGREEIVEGDQVHDAGQPSNPPRDQPASTIQRPTSEGQHSGSAGSRDGGRA